VATVGGTLFCFLDKLQQEVQAADFRKPVPFSRRPCCNGAALMVRLFPWCACFLCNPSV